MEKRVSNSPIQGEGQCPKRKQELIEQLNLEWLGEGGYYQRIYCSEKTIESKDDNDEIAQRNLASSIYYLLTKEEPIGHFHYNKSTIIHYFIEGKPLRYYWMEKDGELHTAVMGRDISKGQKLFLEVPGGYWKASEIQDEGEYALICEVVLPAFYYKDNKIAHKEEFKKEFPEIYQKLSHLVYSEPTKQVKDQD